MARRCRAHRQPDAAGARDGADQLLLLAAVAGAQVFDLLVYLVQNRCDDTGKRKDIR
jgi:hypothetical protein